MLCIMSGSVVCNYKVALQTQIEAETFTFGHLLASGQFITPTLLVTIVQKISSAVMSI